MRGKKIDSEFLSEFITNCVQQSKNSPEDIVKEAKSRIIEIDNKIREVEKLKIIRSKLLDVISTFNFSEENNNRQDEKRVLSLFKIQNPHICKYICSLIKNNNSGGNSAIDIRSISHDKYSNQDIIFCIKQLLEYKIVYRVNDHLLRGEMFEEYLKLVLKEE